MRAIIILPGSIRPPLAITSTHLTTPARTMKVDELVALGGPAPPPPPSPNQDTLTELTKIYYDIYVPGLGTFFETTWYNFKPSGTNPVTILLTNRTLIDLLASFLSCIRGIKSNDPREMTEAGVLETRVVWALASLAYTTTGSPNTASDNPRPQDDAIEARSRLTVFETLISGTSLATNPCVFEPKMGDPHRIREFGFWWWLGEYLRHADSIEGSQAPQREHAMSKMRNLLDGRENRDLLYSLVVIREMAPRFPPNFESNLPQHLDESDPRSKLAVATKFIRDEATLTSVGGGGGTTNVCRRFAELALKAFVHPGINISRQST